MHKTIKLTPDFHQALDTMDKQIISARMSGGPKKTRITVMDADTGEVHGVFENKVVITGSMLSACDIFGIPLPATLPSYNAEMELNNSHEPGTQPKNSPIVCLFCIDDSGCGAEQKDVFVANYIDRIDPKNIMPFRYVDHGTLGKDQREVYFGEKTLDNGKDAYYFKKFDTTPELHLRYTDGTQINEQMYKVDTEQTAECFVESKLTVNRLDLRDYMEQVLGWDKARVSSISLCYAWYDDEIGDFRYYQDIFPYTKLNFSVEWLVDLTKAITFIYDVFY